jgi:hypothetical protein
MGDGKRRVESGEQRVVERAPRAQRKLFSASSATSAVMQARSARKEVAAQSADNQVNH